MSAEHNFEPVFTSLSSKQALSDLVTIPFQEGQLIATVDGNILIDTGAGRGLYSSFMVFDTLSALESADKEQTKLYCVDKVMYRWDGTSLIPIGGGEHTLFVNVLEYNAVTKLAKVQVLDGDGNPTGEIIEGVVMVEDIQIAGGAQTFLAKVVAYDAITKKAKVQVLDKNGNSTGEVIEDVLVVEDMAEVLGV